MHFSTDPNAWRLDWPGHAEFAPGCVQRLGALLQSLHAKRPLVVTDRGLVASGLVQPIVDGLAREGLQARLHDSVEANPSLVHVDQALAAWRDHDADALVAVGGGSAIDTAKVLVALLCSDASLDELVASGDAALTRAAPIFIAVPTTAGTGSEGTLAAVIKDELGRKRVLRSRRTRPQHVLLDPELTISVPPAVTASTGFDVAMHALGAATNRSHHPVGQALAERALRQAVTWLPRVLAEPRSLDARSAMLEASHLAGVAIGLKGVDAIHGLTTPLESVAEAPHGHVLAVVMEPVLHFTDRSEHARYAVLAHACGWPDHSLIERLVALRDACRLPHRLSQIGVPHEALPGLVDAATNGPSTRLHARALTRDDVAALYRSML